MAIRVFTDRDGWDWTAWRVCPTMGEHSPLQGRFRDGWICFQRVDGTERCRLPLDEVPPGWDALPDDRLELLRRVAAQGMGARGTGITEESRRSRTEDAHRGSVSGSRESAAHGGDAPTRA